jgi:SAM-dependent methyltransferase
MWNEFIIRFEKFKADANANADKAATAWKSLEELLAIDSEWVPFHLRSIICRLSEIERRTAKPPEEIILLEHGCGTGSTVAFLLLRGFKACYGVDIGDDDYFEPCSRFFRMRYGLTHDVYRRFDGAELPFENEKFDFIFSRQVFEHVREDLIGSYVATEARTLAKNGIAFHQIPTRNCPWESHTKLWLIHYLPKYLRYRLYRGLGIDYDYVDSILNLKWRSQYLRLFGRYFREIADVTAERMKSMPPSDGYDGSIALRRLLWHMSGVRPLRTLICRNVMMDVILKK